MKYVITITKGGVSKTRTRELKAQSDHKRLIEARTKIRGLIFSGWTIIDIQPE